MARIAVLLVAVIFASATSARAQGPYDDEKTPAGWAWAQIRNDEIADFNTRCGKLDAHAKAGWDDPCRRIPSRFLLDVLTVPKWRDQVARHRVRLIGTLIDGTVDLSDAEITAEVWINASKIEGSLLLADSRWDRALSLQGTTLSGTFSADRMRSASTILLRNQAAIEGDVSLASAKIGSNLEMESSSFAGAVNADSLTVEGNLLMRDHATFGGDVTLRSAKVGASLDMDASSFAKPVNADRLDVGGYLVMRNHANFSGDLILRGAKVGANLEMDTSSFAKTVNGDRLDVGGYLFMRDHATFSGDLSLRSAKVGSNLEMDTSSFAGAVMADPVRVDGNLFMRNATLRGPVSLIGAKIGGNLHLWGSTAWRVDLSGGDARELVLNGLGWWCEGGKAPTGVAAAALQNGAKPAPVHWQLGKPAWHGAGCDAPDPATLPTLILRNTHVDAFQDSADAWPPTMDLEGFHYDRLGGVGGTGRNDMRLRSSDEWTDWLARDRTFSSQPYTELSSVLAAAGHRDTADAILLAGRERERNEACADWSHLGSCMWLTFLSYIAGYGIGLYTFFVLLWVLGLTVLGADVLWYSSNARHQGYWSFGPASTGCYRSSS